MGSLKDVTVLKEIVETAGGDFTVGPLTAADILGIFLAHRAGVEAVFNSYRGEQAADDIFVGLVVTFPEIAAEIIARAAGEPDEESIAVARSLDVGAQLAALEKIGTLTVATAGGLGNLASLVERLAGNLNQVAPGVSRLNPGSKTSASNVPFSSPKDTATPGATHSG